MKEIQTKKIRKLLSISHLHGTCFNESHNIQCTNKIHSYKSDDHDIQRDMIEVWMNIEDSIGIYEMANEKQNRNIIISKEFKQE